MQSSAGQMPGSEAIKPQEKIGANPVSDRNTGLNKGRN